MTDKVWLCQYANVMYIDILNLMVSFPDYHDAVRYYELDIKKRKGLANEKEIMEFKELNDSGLSIKRKWQNTEALEPKNLPTKIYLGVDNTLADVLKRKMFQVVDGYLVVNEEVGNILQQYNLGNTQLSPMYIYDIKTQEQLSDEKFYFVNYAEKREFFVASESVEAWENSYFPESPIRSIGVPKNNDIAVLETAKNCDVDLWHEPNLRESLFMSDKLAQALLQVASAKELGLVSCRLINIQ